MLLSAGGDRITDVDSGAIEGIAITATTNGNGTWEYSTNSGSTGQRWAQSPMQVPCSCAAVTCCDSFPTERMPLAAISPSELGSDRRNGGQQGTKVDVSINGGSTAFSSATEVASITVTSGQRRANSCR